MCLVAVYVQALTTVYQLYFEALKGFEVSVYMLD